MKLVEMKSLSLEMENNLEASREETAYLFVQIQNKNSYDVTREHTNKDWTAGFVEG